MNAQNNKKGFTIIEVALVLAIAALIFLMIFVALPALQRGQANNARKNDASAIATAIGTYRSNHNGDLPTTAAQVTTYLDNLSQVAKSDVTLATSAGTFAANSGNLDKAKIFTNSKCGSAADTTVTGTSRQAAVVTVVEVNGSGSFDAICQNA